MDSRLLKNIIQFSKYSFSTNETAETLENATLKLDSQCRRDFTKDTKLSIRSQ